MVYRTPVLQVLDDNGNDVVQLAGASLIGVKIVDNAGDESDEATFTFSRKPPYPPTPAVGTPFTVRLGWSEDDVAVTGIYTFQASRFSGEPGRGQTMQWVCRAGDFLDTLKVADSQHYDQDNGHKTLGDVFRSAFAGQTVLIDPNLAELPIPGGYVLRWNQSAIDFATALAQENGAVVKAAAGKIIVMMRGAGESVSGKKLNEVRVIFDENYWYDVDLEPRFEYSAVSASWFDVDRGSLERVDQITKVLKGKDALPHPSESKENAVWAAAARARELGNFSGNGVFTVAGNPEAVAMCPLSCWGFGQPIDNVAWEITNVEHNVVPNQGWTTTIEAQVKVLDPDEQGSVVNFPDEDHVET